MSFLNWLRNLRDSGGYQPEPMGGPVPPPPAPEPEYGPWQDVFEPVPTIRRDFRNKTLGQKQRMFALMVAELIQHAYSLGYEVTFGDAYRDPRVHGEVGHKKSYSSANSVHKQRLAIDLNLFKNGKYLTATEDHLELGEFWESLGGSWGGRFNDGNHYSIEHNGRK